MARSALLAKRQELNMTSGSEVRLILTFSLPLLAGNIFQQLYNMVDTWTVGNFVGNEAFSAVGTVTPIINTLLSVFVGFSAGSSVVLSQYYGAKNYEKVHDAVHTTITLAVILSVLLTALGIFAVPAMLHLTKTPVSVFPEAKAYLTIIFAGLTGMLLYNTGAGILRAVGDSQRPFYYLVCSAVLNTVLDLLFVIKFHLGVRGVAYATIIAQGVSAVLALGSLLRADNCVKLSLRDLKIHRDLLKKIVFTGLPAAIQMGITAFSNVFVQSYINQFDEYCMGGWTAYHKVDMLLMLPMQSIGMAATTFVGQNLGCGQSDRARHGVRTATVLAFIITVGLSLLVVLFAPQIVVFFISEPETISFGVLFLRCLTPFYCACCVNQVLMQALRGAGDSKGPMIICLFSFVLFRQVYLFVVSHFISNTVLPIAMGYPAGWIMCSLLMVLYYHSHDLGRTALVSESERRT